MDAKVAERIQASFQAQSMMCLINAEISNIDIGAVEIQAPIADSTLQQQSFAHAGLAFTLGDSAAGFSALTMLGADQEVVTSEMKIHLLRPGTGKFLIARGRVIKAGQRLVVAAADVYDNQGGQEKLMATLLGTSVPTPV